MKIWILKVGDSSLYLAYEYGYEHDRYAVAVMILEQTVGHILRNSSKILELFLLFQTVSSNIKLLEIV